VTRTAHSASAKPWIPSDSLTRNMIGFLSPPGHSIRAISPAASPRPVCGGAIDSCLQFFAGRNGLTSFYLRPIGTDNFVTRVHYSGSGKYPFLAPSWARQLVPHILHSPLETFANQVGQPRRPRTQPARKCLPAVHSAAGSEVLQ